MFSKQQFNITSIKIQHISNMSLLKSTLSLRMEDGEFETKYSDGTIIVVNYNNNNTFEIKAKERGNNMFFDKAKPIWISEKKMKNVLISFETLFNYNGGKVVINIAADSCYRLKINDRIISHGPARCGKGTWRVDEIEITSAIKKGNNSINISVLNYGAVSFEFVNQQGFLQAEVFCNDQSVLYTGVAGNFVARLNLSRDRVTERYSVQRPFLEVWHLPIKYSEPFEIVEVENIKLTKRYAPYPKYDKEYPISCVSNGRVEYGNDEIYPNTMLLERDEIVDFSFPVAEIKPFYRKIMRSIRNKTSNIINKTFSSDFYTLEKNDFIIFEFEKEKTGFINCEIETNENSTLYFIFDEILVDNDVQPFKHYPNMANILPITIESGKYEFTAFDAKSMKYLKIVCPEGFAKVRPSLIKFENPVAYKAKFECDDNSLKRIYDAAVNTFSQNAVDIFTDCPSRERAGWLCDSFFTARAEKDLTGESNIERGFLENFFIADEFDDNIPIGMLPMCYPSNQVSSQFIPNWAMFAVLELEEYYARTNDNIMIQQAKNHMYNLNKYLSGFENNDGLLENLESWVFVEWSKANDWVQNVNFPTNMLYYAMLMAMSRLYDDNLLFKKAEKLKHKICDLSFNGKFFRDHMIKTESGKYEVPEDITEVCQYYAFFTGVADKEKYSELLKIIVNDFGPGGKCKDKYEYIYPANAFIGNYLRLEVLAETGYRNKVYEEIKSFFDYMAIRTGTLWENDSPKASCNHGFASHVVRSIFRDCLGINKIDEIRKTVELNYDYSSPQNASAIIPLKSGTIIVTVRNKKRTVEIEGNYKLLNG